MLGVLRGPNYHIANISMFLIIMHIITELGQKVIQGLSLFNGMWFRIQIRGERTVGKKIRTILSKKAWTQTNMKERVCILKNVFLNFIRKISPSFPFIYHWFYPPTFPPISLHPHCLFLFYKLILLPNFNPFFYPIILPLYYLIF